MKWNNIVIVSCTYVLYGFSLIERWRNLFIHINLRDTPRGV